MNETVNTWAEEDAGRWLTDAPSGDYCPKPCLGVSVLHPKHEATR